jgi:DNA-binding transcriptional regulator YdaS (Cro superfamily)
MCIGSLSIFVAAVCGDASLPDKLALTPSQLQQNTNVLLLLLLSDECSVEFATSREEIDEEYHQRVKEFKRSRSSVSAHSCCYILGCSLGFALAVPLTQTHLAAVHQGTKLLSPGVPGPA